MAVRTVRIQGGLGNQLFGLAFARSVALAGGGGVDLDISSYGADVYGRGFMTGDLAARIDGARIVSRPLLGARAASAVLRALPVDPPGFVREPATLPAGFDLTAFAARRGYFDGYWQDEAFILDPAPLRAWVRRFVLDQASAAPAVDAVIHYRTYKEENHPVFSRTPGRPFFEAALARIEAACGPAGDIVLVSDDPDLALARLGPAVAARVRPSEGAGWADDMALMLRARALILTNSSFSWWGGWCGEAAMTVYPARGELFHYPQPAAGWVCVQSG